MELTAGINIESVGFRSTNSRPIHDNSRSREKKRLTCASDEEVLCAAPTGLKISSLHAVGVSPRLSSVAPTGLDGHLSQGIFTIIHGPFATIHVLFRFFRLEILAEKAVSSCFRSVQSGCKPVFPCYHLLLNSYSSPYPLLIKIYSSRQ